MTSSFDSTALTLRFPALPWLTRVRATVRGWWPRAVASPVAEDVLDTQLLEGLLGADHLLRVFGVGTYQIDLSALVALRVIEGADPDATVAMLTTRLVSLTGRAPAISSTTTPIAPEAH